MNTRLVFALLVLCHMFAHGARGQVVEEVYDFTQARAADLGSEGHNPTSALVQGSDGNFYGTTKGNGIDSLGTVFKMTPDGVLTTLVEFTENGATNKGAGPEAGLVEGSDGNFYGTTKGGGASDFGTVFRATPGGVLTTMLEFTGAAGANKGRRPSGALVLGSDGNFYGTTILGGVNNLGTVFRLTPAGVLTTLVEFTGTGGASKGSSPQSALVEGSDGNFYGTTAEGGGGGGALGRGTVFKMTPAGVLTTLVEFTGTGGANNGAFPLASLVQGSDGGNGSSNGNGKRGSGPPRCLRNVPAPACGRSVTSRI